MTEVSDIQCLSQPDSSDDVHWPDGLSEAVAQQRLARFGKNTLTTKAPPGFLVLFLQQFKHLLMGILIGAGALTWFLGDWDHALVLELVVVVNALIGALMEYRAQRTLQRLGTYLSIQARIRRDGVTRIRPATDIVAGDLVELETGDRIPADGILLQGSLLIDESLLTGESVSVAKSDHSAVDKAPNGEKSQLLLSGTTVQAGCGVMHVTGTGSATALGHISSLLERQETASSPLVRKMDDLGKSLALLFGLTSAVLFGLGLWQGRELWPLLQTVVILAVAAIPEGLPAVATVALATGALHMARAGLWVRRLSAVGTLGHVTTVCLDKTGTLTCNEMTACQWWTPSGRYGVSGSGWQTEGAFFSLDDGETQLEPGRIPDLARALAIGAWCNLAQVQGDGDDLTPRGDPVDVALLVAALKAGLPVDARDTDSHTLEVPQAGKPWMVRTHQGVRMVKGRALSVLERCTGCWNEQGGRDWRDSDERAFWVHANRKMAEQGLRVLGMAQETADGHWVWIGLVGLQDPLRDDARASVAALQKLGLTLVMLTGDQHATASAIARKLRAHASGPASTDAQWVIHSQIDPEEKWRLIRERQAAHEVVLMIGDGVNDAPALRVADVGVAIWGGHAVASDAASAVLTQPSLMALADAVSVGRTILLRMERAIDYLISCSFTTLIVVAMASALNLPIPLNPLQILYLNVLTHGVLALGLVFESGWTNVPRPIETHASVLSKRRRVVLVRHCMVMGMITLAAQTVSAFYGGFAHSQTVTFVTLASVLICHLMVDRSDIPLGGWRIKMEPGLVACIVAAASLQVAAIVIPPLTHYLALTPLQWWDGALIIGASLLGTGLSEWIKAQH